MPSSADSVVAFNSGMTVAKAFGTPGTPQAEVTATPLFPFTSPYSVYAGSCEENNPSLAGESTAPGTIAEALVAAGGEHAGDDRAAGAAPDGLEWDRRRKPGRAGRRRRR